MELTKTIKFVPAIKWSGSKRSQVSTILSYIPSFERYYEPFVGGASVAYSVTPEDGICGDNYAPLIEFWQKVKENPDELADSYTKRWHQLQDEGYMTFYHIRDRFNSAPKAEDLLFLSRTCVNGLIRFNKSGEFNNALHHTRKGINPETFRRVLQEWSERIQGITFVAGDYRDTTQTITANDFVYLDPPYFNTKSRYFGTIEYEPFLEYLDWLNSKGVKYALSYDGCRGEKSYMVDLPKELYKQHLLIKSGNASFRKVMDGQNEMVTESLYLNY
jgi:DNA adenine methylase